MNRVSTVVFACLFSSVLIAQAQSRPGGVAAAEGGAQSRSSQLPQASDTADLERDFFSLMRSGNVKKFLSYVPKGGVNVGADAQHLTQQEVEEQLQQQRGLYCKLFDSACIQSKIQLDNSASRVCSYRELLTKSKNVKTTSSETTRNGVRQAILVARLKNDQCSGVGLVDFIFNYQSDGWKLFSIP
jgi:hypothetical protein